MTGFSLAEEMQAFEFMALSTLSSSLLHNTHRITCSNYTDDIMPHIFVSLKEVIFVSLKEVENKSMKIPFFSRLNIAGKNATSGSQTSVYMQTDLPCFGCVWVQAGFSLAENTEAVVQQKIASTAAGQWRFLEPLWVCSCGGRLPCQGGRWEFGAGGVQKGIPPAIPSRGGAGSSF